MTDDEAYSAADTEEIKTASIYEGVNREIYKKGGVALTSDALRADAESLNTLGSEDRYSILTIVFASISGLLTLTSAVTGIGAIKGYMSYINLESKLANKSYEIYDRMLSNSYRIYNGLIKVCVVASVAMIIFGLATIIMQQAECAAYYRTNFTPIPRYMVDEADITAYNELGEKTVIKNQAAYYKAVDSNRADNNKHFTEIGTLGDLNGTVGRQWVALYVEKNESKPPILADSFKVVVNDSNVPAGYTTGVHMFGSGAAFNLNNELYVWNKDAPSTFIYYKVEQQVKSPSESGSAFAAGGLALTGIGGAIIGAFISTVILKTNTKKKKSA